MRIALYARVSTTDQDCSMQIAEMRTYASARGWTVEHEYIDTGFSGKKKSRPDLDKLMASARKRSIDCVIVWKLDRLGRSLSHLVQTVQEFDSLGIRFIAITQGIDTDQNNPTSRLLLHLLACMAEFERELICERVTCGVRRAQKEGTRSGKPFGRPAKVFRRDRVIELRNQGLSIRAIADQLGVAHPIVQRALAKAAV